MTAVLSKLNQSKIVTFILAALIACVAVYGIVDASAVDANSAFDKINIGGEKVDSGTKLDDGLYNDMNTILTVFLSIAGFIVIACLIFAGVKLATAQNNPQNRTQGFIGLGMALLGGWIVYKALDLAGWIKGFGN
jgi:Type IV secretion system pilin